MANAEAGWKQKVDLFRKRFGSREDVFGVKYYYKQTQYDPEDVARENPRLVETSIYQPQCMNYGDQRVCLIAQNKGGCSTCDHKKYQPLTDEWIWKHISGQKELILYLVQKDGIKFGACDFDRGTHFEDAKAVREVSRKFGLPCYIARSSKKGYHLYWFFSDLVPAHLFTSLVQQIYDELGFNQRYQENPTNPPPEVFPKQTAFNPSPSSPGNGIKIPMIEPKFKEGFNCWVDDSAVPLPSEDQWEYFKSCREVSLQQIENVIEKHKIPVIHSPVGRSKRAVDSGQKQAIKPKGDFWRIIDNCPALKQFWDKDSEGNYKISPNAVGDHFHRTASIAFAIATENGLEAVRDRWNSENIEKEINYALETKQRPWTCKAMQENGLCRIGVHPTKKDHCIKKTPPGEVVNGQYLVNPNNLPESEWKDPSPIRFATGFQTHDQLIRRLEALFDYQNKKEGDKPASPPENLAEELKDILSKAWDLGPETHKTVKDFIEIRKALKEKDLKVIYKSVEKEKKEKDFEKKKAECLHFNFDGSEYIEEPGGYYEVKVDQNGVPQRHELTNFKVSITEELTLIHPVDLDDPTEGQTVEHRWLKGAIREGRNTYPFKTPSSEFIRSPESFFTFLTNRAGTNLLYKTSNYNAIRNCVSEFSKDRKVIRKKVEDFGHYWFKGEHAFVTPSVIITKDQIKPNKEFELEFNEEACKPLDFKIIDDSQFKELALHIVTDYFECSSSMATMSLFAQALAASVLSHIPLAKSPVMWVDGSLGEGKSFIAEAAQCLYGNFTKLSASDSTGVGKLAQAHVFRDSLLVFDDFKKSLSEYNTKGLIQFIQKAYDRSGRNAAKRDGKLREESTRIRGLIAITGEDPPFEEASTISRLIIVEVKKDSMNVVLGEKVKERRNDYCGLMPYFIQFVYNVGEAAVRKLYLEYIDVFEKNGEASHGENMYRVCQNLAFNMVSFRLWTDLLVERGVIPIQKRDELCDRHIKNLEICREKITSNTKTQRGATVFLNRLRELLQDPVRFHITNLPGYDPTDHKNSKALGFYRSATPGVAFIYPSTTHGEVETHLGKTKTWSQSQHHIARQLFEDGHLAMYDPSSTSFMKYVKTPSGARHYCWAIKLESLGFTTEPETPSKKESQPIPDNVVSIAVNE